MTHVTQFQSLWNQFELPQSSARQRHFTQRDCCDGLKFSGKENVCWCPGADVGTSPTIPNYPRKFTQSDAKHFPLSISCLGSLWLLPFPTIGSAFFFCRTFGNQKPEPRNSQMEIGMLDTEHKFVMTFLQSSQRRMLRALRSGVQV